VTPRSSGRRQTSVGERQHEVALTPDEVDEILRQCGHGVLLVGGQALAFWAVRYGVEPVGELSKKITSDADFIGTASEAKALGAALRWTVWLATMDDAGGQTAKVTKQIPGGGVKQVDYLSGIVGLDTAKIQARAVEALLPSGVTVRILHPLDVLESRLRNLVVLPSKQNAVGIAQAKLAIAVAGKFANAMLDSRVESRTVLSAIERIVTIALDKVLIGVAVDYGLDVLGAVPASRIKSPEFQTARWPRILKKFTELKLKHEQRAAGRGAPSRSTSTGG
jgi:hypothetical protein